MSAQGASNEIGQIGLECLSIQPNLLCMGVSWLKIRYKITST
jgi:hypothetical protein